MSLLKGETHFVVSGIYWPLSGSQCADMPPALFFSGPLPPSAGRKSFFQHQQWQQQKTHKLQHPLFTKSLNLDDKKKDNDRLWGAIGLVWCQMYPSHLITALQFIVANEDSQIHKWGSHIKSVTYHCITIGQIHFVNDGLSLFLVQSEGNDW